MSFPGNIIPSGEIQSMIVKKCEPNGVWAFSIRLSKNSDEDANEYKQKSAGVRSPSWLDLRLVAKIR
jgi:hypothetical protein